MKTMGSYTFPLSFLCLDVCLMHATCLAQFSPLLASQPLLALWGAGLARAFLLILLTFSYPGDLPWRRSFKGLQGLAVLCFLFPAHFTLLWALGWHSMLEVMGCHTWERVGTADIPLAHHYNPRMTFSTSPIVYRKFR